VVVVGRTSKALVPYSQLFPLVAAARFPPYLVPCDSADGMQWAGAVAAPQDVIAGPLRTGWN
jgi:hypothetical protein